MIVVRRSSGANSSRKLGRFKVPASFFFCHEGDSGKNGRMTISGIAGINPDINVYRHAASGFLISPRKLKKLGNSTENGMSAAYFTASPLAYATSNPPNELNACVYPKTRSR